MIRLLPQPGLLTSLVVAGSVASGLAAGLAVTSLALALRALTQMTRR